MCRGAYDLFRIHIHNMGNMEAIRNKLVQIWTTAKPEHVNNVKFYASWKLALQFVAVALVWFEFDLHVICYHPNIHFNETFDKKYCLM